MSSAWDGRPDRPEEIGWHWLAYAAEERSPLFCKLWMLGMWCDVAGHSTLSAEAMPKLYRYVAPCLNPDEQAAALREAEARGMERAAGMLADRAEAYTALEGMVATIMANEARDAARSVRAKAAALRAEAGREG